MTTCTASFCCPTDHPGSNPSCTVVGCLDASADGGDAEGGNEASDAEGGSEAGDDGGGEAASDAAGDADAGTD
jgi:hypothetical protein